MPQMFPMPMLALMVATSLLMILMLIRLFWQVKGHSTSTYLTHENNTFTQTW